MPAGKRPKPQDRVVFAILAEQAMALRESLAGPEFFERLMACGELLTSLSSHLTPGSDAASAAARLDIALDAIAFHQAQHHDLARQTAELVGRALKILADSPGALAPTDLAALYVSDQQRRLHDDILTAYLAAGA